MITKYQIEKAKENLSEELKICDELKVMFLTEIKAVIEAMEEICRDEIDEEEKKKASAATEAREKFFCIDPEELKTDLCLAIRSTITECCCKFNNISYTNSGSLGENSRVNSSIRIYGDHKKSFYITVEFSSLKES